MIRVEIQKANSYHFDWGQDTKRLSNRLREVGAKEVTFGTLLIADFEAQHGFPHMAKEFDVMNPAPGWNAVSMTNWKEFRFGLLNRYPDYELWPDRYEPMERVGKSILLYYFDRPARRAKHEEETRRARPAPCQKRKKNNKSRKKRKKN